MLGMSKANGAYTRPGRSARVVSRPRHWAQAQVENPLAQEGVGPESTGLRLLVEPGPGVKSREVISVDLTPQNVQVVNAEGAPTKERWLVLPPGEEVRLSIRRKVNASPGRYRAHVECRFRLHEQRDSVEGLLTIDLGTFEVVRAVKSK